MFVCLIAKKIVLNEKRLNKDLLSKSINILDNKSANEDIPYLFFRFMRVNEVENDDSADNNSIIAEVMRSYRKSKKIETNNNNKENNNDNSNQDVKSNHKHLLDSETEISKKLEKLKFKHSNTDLNNTNKNLKYTNQYKNRFLKSNLNIQKSLNKLYKIDSKINSCENCEDCQENEICNTCSKNYYLYTISPNKKICVNNCLGNTYADILTRSCVKEEDNPLYFNVYSKGRCFNSCNLSDDKKDCSCKYDCVKKGNCCRDYSVCQFIQKLPTSTSIKYCLKEDKGRCIQCYDNYYLSGSRCLEDCENTKLKSEENRLCLPKNGKSIYYLNIKIINKISYNS